MDSKVNVELLNKLQYDGLLNEEAYQAAVKILHPEPDWYPWARRMLLFFGASLILAGIIFFFAYNWADMNKFLKFGLLEGGIICCVAGVWWRGMANLSGKIILLSAAVLTGVLLAVFGQTYQTGADAYQLFFGWAVLILGWVFISEFAPLWFIWLVLLNTGLVLFWEQAAPVTYGYEGQYLYLALAGINGVALVLREVGVKRGVKWLNGEWLRLVLTVAVLVNLTIPVIMLIDDLWCCGFENFIAAGGWFAVIAFGYWCYRKVLKDVNQLALIILNICVVVLALAGKLVFKSFRYHDGSAFFILTLIVLVVVGLAAWWLRKTAKSMASEVENE